MRLITVLGGYGVFGGRIAAAVARQPGARVRIAGRTPKTGERFAGEIGGEFRCCDINDRMSLQRAIDGSYVVVHTAGPFQGSDYRVAECCIACRSHYIDIADGRDFVSGIVTLDTRAREHDLFVTAGASSVPATTHAMISDLLPAFQQLNEIQIALSPGNRNPRGPSTIAAILSYLGRPIRVWNDGQWTLVTGWGRRIHMTFPDPLGRRTVYDCDAPDNELFPEAFGARTVQFHAGLELEILNRTLEVMARLRNYGLLRSLPRYAWLMAKASRLLVPFGSRKGALGVWLRGTDRSGHPLERRIALVTDCDGPAIPVAPVISLLKRLIAGKPPATGAFPCLGLVSLRDLADSLSGRRMWLIRGTAHSWDPTTCSPFGALD